MKKIIILICLFFITKHNAQPLLNDKIFGGSGNISISLRNDESDAATFNAALQPIFGYMFKEKWSVQTSVGIVYSYSNYINIQDKKRYIFNKMYLTTQLGFRRYWLFKEKIGFYIEPRWNSYIKTSDKVNIDGERKNVLKYQKQFNMSFGAEPGFIFFLKENLSIECSIGGIGYSIEIEKWQNNTKLRHTFNTLVRPVGVSVGVQYYFRKASKTQ